MGDWGCDVETLIVILLVLIVVLLVQILNKDEGKGTEKHKTTFTKSNRPAFTREEWGEAVNAWYQKEIDDDIDRMAKYGGAGPPIGMGVWQPPPYEEVKDDLNALMNLRMMAGLDKKKLS